jgi:hypothetical protein
MDGVGSGRPACDWGSPGPEGQWAWGEGQVSWRAVRLAPGWDLAQTGGGDPDGHGSSSTAKGQVFWHGVGGVAEGWVSHCVDLEQSCGLVQAEGR